MNKNPNCISHVRLAILASATAALLAGVATPADALGLFGEPRMATAPRGESMPQRAVRPATPTPATRAKATVVSKVPIETNELAAKAKGPLQILVSLDKQELTLLSGGEVIARSRVSTGQRGRSTPTGVFSIIQKDRWHRSNLYDDAPMWFMQRITWSGVALHQGIVPNYPASHGCIRLPEAFAKQLWTTTQMGARVIITHEQAMPVAIEHPALFVPRKEPAAPAMAQQQALEAAKQAWTFAELASSRPIAGMTMTDLNPSLSTPDAAAPALDAVKPVTRPLKPGPLSVFISRKEGKLFVRKGFEPLFDVPVTIDRPAEPLGTHVFTAIGLKADASLRWSVVTAENTAGTRAAAALDRITIPQEAIERISELVAPGSSITISDHGLGGETGKGTDFIVLTK